MPELPEVETTCRGLKDTVLGLSIGDFWCDTKRMCLPDISSIQSAVRDAKITSVERRGKNILIHLSSKKSLLIHLKMTGHLMYGTYMHVDEAWIPNDQNRALYDPYNRFIHAVFQLRNGKSLVFCDARKFGSIELISSDAVALHPRLSRLGPEPIHPAYTEKYFSASLVGVKRTIKPLLLDQGVFSGIGNIYADESLFRAGIHPLRPANTLTKKEQHLLFVSIRELLQSGIDFGGDSTSDYRNIFGERGTFHGTHQVYRRTGMPCLKAGCGGTIQRIVVSGRGTHFCPLCQPHI